MSQTQTIDTVGTPSEVQAARALRVPQHPYLTAAEGLEDLQHVCGMILEACEELAPVFRSATPPSVQMGGARAKDGEPFGFVNATTINRATVQLAMLVQQAGMVSSVLQSLSGEMTDAGVDAHMPSSDGDE